MPTGIIGRLFLAPTLLIAIFSAAQEPYEDRAARLQPQDIPPLIEKGQAGDLSSQVLLWLAYSGGHGVPKDFQKGVPWLRKAAEQGSLESQFILSTVYAFGRDNFLPDHAEAFKWALLAAQRGHMIAQHNVAADYFDGFGVNNDLEQARYWYTCVAQQGFAHSEWMLGRIYVEGIGVAPNREEGLKWLSKSLAQGHSPTMMTLAAMYSDPNGIPQDPQLVFDLHRAAAGRGNHFAEFELGRFYRAGYLGAPDYVQAVMWFQKAAAANYGPADQKLGEMYEAGKGVSADPAQARTHYERAADLGVWGAIQRLGEIYRDGTGVASNPVNACMWFTIGAKMGSPESESALQILTPKLTEAQRQMAAALTNTWILEHPDAMEQKPGHFRYQDWTRVERGPQASRPPSTPEERAYAIRLTHNLETNPLSRDSSAARAWLDQWWNEIPDIMVRPCNLVDSPNHDPNPYADELYRQITYSEGAFILQSSAKGTDWDAAFLAGMQVPCGLTNPFCGKHLPRDLRFLRTYSRSASLASWLEQCARWCASAASSLSSSLDDVDHNQRDVVLLAGRRRLPVAEFGQQLLGQLGCRLRSIVADHLFQSSLPE
jgi:TPR repeat protein